MISINCKITEEALSRLPSITGSTKPGIRDAREVVLLVVSLIEEYVDRVLDLLIDSSAIAGSAFGKIVVGKLQTSWHQTWSLRKEWLRDGFDLEWSRIPDSAEFMTLLELRNSLTHGGQSLTGNQTKNLAGQLGLEKRFKSELAIRFVGHTMHLSDEMGTIAQTIARKLILGIDLELSGALSVVKLSGLIR